MDVYLGSIVMVAFDYAPAGWAPCDGRLLQIAQYQALYSLLGARFGGDGKTTFGLPDLRARVPVHAGPNYPIAARGGSESVTLTANQLGGHTHPVNASDGSRQSTASPVGNVPGAQANTNIYRSGSPTAATPMHAGMLQPAGNSQPHENRQPFLGMNYIIALQGLYPPRT